MLSKFAETVLRPRAGDGIVPQLVEKAHSIMDEAYFSRCGVSAIPMTRFRCKRYY
jgi:hypothetical protein